MNLDLYCKLMNEVKMKTTAIAEIRNGTKSTSFVITNIEFCCLQIRKIIELVALSSLVANKNQFERLMIKFEHLWNLKEILKDIKKLNPDFYPQPITEIPSSDPIAKIEWKHIDKGYMTIDDIYLIYSKCGKILHSDNPFGAKTDLEYYKRQIDLWLDKIVKLLNCHLIKIIGDDNLYLIHMKENKDELVHGYVFAPHSPNEPKTDSFPHQSPAKKHY